MIVIFEGSVQLFITTDAGTEFPLETLPTGSIINPHNFLVDRKHSISGRFTLNTTFYYLTLERMTEIGYRYPEFGRELYKQKGQATAMMQRDH